MLTILDLVLNTSTLVALYSLILYPLIYRLKVLDLT